MDPEWDETIVQMPLDKYEKLHGLLPGGLPDEENGSWKKPNTDAARDLAIEGMHSNPGYL